MGSLFAGIGGFDLGFERAGLSVAWHAEIDRHASAILREHWPGVPNLGDVTKIDGAAIEPVDVICGGFPCQDLSVAGKRAGFTGKRSVLAFEFLRIVAEMRSATNGSAPTFVVLENVPGLFSSSGGRDFGALLDALAELRPLDIAWRVLDSRYFNVAQRRERVFVVVDFGGERCDEILALTEGLRGDSPARRAAREDVAGTLGGGAQSRGWCDDLDRADAFITDDVAFPVLSREGKGPASSVDSGNIIPFDPTQVTSPLNRSVPQPCDPCHPLAAGAHAPAVAYSVAPGNCSTPEGQEDIFLSEIDVSRTLDCTGADPARKQGGTLVSSGVRRLTPRECERLQGFPDDWTGIPGMADGPRYKCLGNAVTVNVAEWLAARVRAASAPGAKGGGR